MHFGATEGWHAGSCSCSSQFITDATAVGPMECCICRLHSIDCTVLGHLEKLKNRKAVGLWQFVLYFYYFQCGVTVLAGAAGHSVEKSEKNVAADNGGAWEGCPPNLLPGRVESGSRGLGEAGW